jgi:hypothetical protein
MFQQERKRKCPVQAEEPSTRHPREILAFTRVTAYKAA